MNHLAALGDRRELELAQGTIIYHESGEGPPLVFIHGLLVSAPLWRKVVPRLAGRFRCIVPEWPLGSHTVPMAPDADLSPPGFARLIADALDKLELEDATLVANDTGGAFTQIAAAEHPERIGRLVLATCDSLERFFPPQFNALPKLARLPATPWIMAQTLRSARVRRSMLGYGMLSRRPLDDDVTRRYVEPLLRDAGVRRDLGKVLRGVHRRHTIAAAERLRDFHHPVLLAWAAQDRLFPLDLAQRLASMLPDARLEPIEDSLTFVPEDQPERLAELVGDFAARALDAAPAGGP
jgi:pimeloyl-ACP methyl ester carboxylesterase